MTLETAVRNNRDVVVATFDIFAKQMRDDIKLTVTDKDGNPKHLEYKGEDITSGYHYCAEDFVRAVDANSQDELLKDLVHKMNWFGLYAQQVFNYNPVAFDKPQVIEDFNDEVLEEYKVQNTGNAEGIGYTSGSLMLDSDTGIRVFFTVEDNHSIDEYTFTVDGTEVEPMLQTGKKYFVTIKNMAAKELNVWHTIEVTDSNNNTLTTKYCGLSYTYAVVTNANAPDTLKNLCRAVYLYWDGAYKFFNQ
jgi:hypothetical protein